jgi:hypothetical protein
VKSGCNLADSSEEGYGSKRAVLLMMKMMMLMNDCSASEEFPIYYVT